MPHKAETMLYKAETVPHKADNMPHKAETALYIAVNMTHSVNATRPKIKFLRFTAKSTHKSFNILPTVSA